MANAHFLTRKQEDQIIAKYLSGKTGKQIAAAGFHWSTVYTMLRRRGIATRPQTECQRKYALDQNFFEKIDTEEKAYWLGFLTADGNVSAPDDYRRCRLTVNLARRDRSHLEKLVLALKSELPILDLPYERFSDKGTRLFTSRAIFCSQKLVTDLIRLGVTPRKSLTVRPWIGPVELMRHYWRGVLDGDGSLGKYLIKSEFKGDGKIHIHNQWIIRMFGSKWVVQAFADFIGEHVGLRKRARKNLKIFRVAYGGLALPQMITRLLYENATVFLDRKKALADDLIRARLRQRYRGGLSLITREQLELLFARFQRWDDVAKHLGVWLGPLRRHRQRLGIYRDGREHSWKWAKWARKRFRTNLMLSKSRRSSDR